MSKPMTLVEEAERFHAACKMIELDGCEGYFACRERFGSDVAGAVLVMWLRTRLYKENEYDKTKAKVNQVLEEAGRLKNTISVEVPATDQDLAGLHDVLVDGGVENPSYDLVRAILHADRSLACMAAEYGPNDTEVRGRMLCNLKDGQYKEIVG